MVAMHLCSVCYIWAIRPSLAARSALSASSELRSLVLPIRPCLEKPETDGFPYRHDQHQASRTR